MSYDAGELCVDFLWFVPKYFFVPEIIERRQPLSDHARRRGWVGCSILFDYIPEQGRIPIVSNRIPAARSDIQQRLSRAEKLCFRDVGARSWLMDVLSCVNRIRDDRFSLGEIYSYEAELRARHPKNSNIRAKIRQQLQLLRDRGVLEFEGRGLYVKKA